jgi:hypothetical protein
MKTFNLRFIAIFSLILLQACTSDQEKAEKLGFSNHNQMVYIKSLGFANYGEFKSAHPYVIKSDSTKFAEAIIGGVGSYFGAVKQSDNGLFIEMKSGVILGLNQDGKINDINYFCDDANKDNNQVSIDDVDCKITKSKLKEKLVNIKEYCTVSYFDDDRLFLHNKAFFNFNGDKLSKLGILDSINMMSIGHEGYQPCNQVLAKESQRKSAGFESISQMEDALSNGLKTGLEWREFLAMKNFRDMHSQAKNLLEKALVIHASTLEDARAHKEDGGLNRMNAWRGFMVQSYEIVYKEEKASIILLSVDRLLEAGKEINYPSVNNIKKILEPECGRNWKLGRASNDAAYLAETEKTECRFYEDKRLGGMFIEISRSSSR